VVTRPIALPSRSQRCAFRDAEGTDRYPPPIAPEPDDQTLVAAAQRGDVAALDALLRRHHDRVYAVCRRLAGNEHDAHDAAQEALIAIARGIRRFDGRSAFTTWAYRVATNACLDEMRRRGRRPQPGRTDDLGDDTSAFSPAGEGSAGIEVLPDRMAIDAALEELPPEFRVPVVLRDLCDLDYGEIADVLGIPPGTVRSRISRGRRQLADLLDIGNQPTAEQRPTVRKDTGLPS
jgi:RNA polymerase sigma-70 factor, ECF subfamily